MIAGCPLPYQFSREGWSGNSGTVDPSTPDVTAMPRIAYSQQVGGGGTVDVGTASTASDTAINLVTDTPGSVIYYTVDGSSPDPRSAKTAKFTPGTSIPLAISNPTPLNSSTSIAIKATAIGPNMKPSPVMSAGLTLQYPQASAPNFSVPGGAYSTDQSLTMSTTTAGAAIYYTMVPGAGPAPAPVPGQAGTTQYSGPIALTGPNSAWTISAVATASQMINSTTTSASYSVSYAVLPDPTFNPPGGTYTANQSVVIASGPGSTIWYTTDGTPPIPNSSPSITSGGSIPMTGKDSSGQVTLSAIATQSQKADSNSVQTLYTFRAATPSPAPGLGTYFTSVSITGISTSAPVDQIYFTDDGSTPSPTNTLSSLPITFSSSFILTTVAYKTNYLHSVPTAYHYTVIAPDYQSITPAIIASQDSVMTTTAIDNSDGNIMPVGELILYKTSSGNYGAMVITTVNADGNHGILFRFTTYNPDGSVLASNTSAQCRGTFPFDLDLAPAGSETAGTADFWMDNQSGTARLYVPQNGAKFTVAGVDPTP